MTLSVLLALLAGARGGLWQSSSEKDEIRARRYVLVDAQGKALGEFGTGRDGSVRLVVRRGDNGPQAWMGLLPDGKPYMALTYADDAGMVSLIGNEEAPAIQVWGPGGRSRMVIQALKDSAATITLSDANGKPRVLLGTYDDGAAGITLFDGSNMQRGFFMAYPERSPTLHIVDADKNVVWKAP